MKRFISLSVLLCGVFLLVACGSNNENVGFDFNEDGENIVTMQLESEDVHNTITLEATGDAVQKQTTVNEATYENYGVSSKESAEVAFNDVVAQYRQVDGLTYDVEFLDEGVKEVLTIDFEEVDVEALKKVPGIQFDGNIKKGVSLKATVEQLEESGYIIES